MTALAGDHQVRLTRVLGGRIGDERRVRLDESPLSQERPRTQRRSVTSEIQTGGNTSPRRGPLRSRKGSGAPRNQDNRGLRHEVRTSPHILSLRVDESLYFANARYLEDKLYDMVAQRPELRHVILMCTAVNEIDASALESLEAINQRLDQLGVFFHLSEVKGPVMDQL